MFFGWQFDPVAAHNLRVCHEPDLEVDVGLKGRVGDVVEVGEVDLAFLQQTFGWSNQLGHGQSYLDEGDHLVALKSVNGRFAFKHDVENCLSDIVFVVLHVVEDGLVQ